MHRLALDSVSNVVSYIFIKKRVTKTNQINKKNKKKATKQYSAAKVLVDDLEILCVGVCVCKERERMSVTISYIV